MTDPNDSDPAKLKLEYFEEWLRRFQQAKLVEPAVIKMLSTAAWEADAMRALRSESPGMAREIDAELARGVQSLTSSLPLPPAYDQGIVPSSSAVTVSSANMVLDALISVQGQPPHPQSFLAPLIKRYWQVQEEQGREAEAAGRLAELFPGLAERFAEATRNAHIALASITNFAEETAAMAMRTFLGKLKGELMDKARQSEREKLTWAQMAERLCTGPNERVFRDQERLYESLTDWLSNIGKARSSAFSFKDTWVRFLDHVYIVCGAVLASKKP